MNQPATFGAPLRKMNQNGQNGWSLLLPIVEYNNVNPGLNRLWFTNPGVPRQIVVAP